MSDPLNNHSLLYRITSYNVCYTKLLRGVRREAGNQAKVLNEMMEVFMSMGSHMKAQDKLKEFVGHTPLQVLAGAILGVLVAVVVSAS